MSTIRENYKKILLVTLIILLIPVIGLLVQIISTYGNLVGTIARKIMTKGIC